MNSRVIVFGCLILFLLAMVPRMMGVLLAAPDCDKVLVMEVGETSVWQLSEDTAFFYKAKMSIDADGAPNAYHPENIPEALDSLGNAGEPGNWWGIVTHNGKKSGRPVIQKEGDPFPGYYVSTTSLQDGSRPLTDPRRYVDSSKIPYIVLPPDVLEDTEVRLGDFAMVVNSRNGKKAAAIFADTGPRGKLGEGSIALAEALGIPSSPKKGGIGGGIIYVVFPGSGNRKPRLPGEIATEGERHFKAWGGLARVQACFP